MAIHEIGDASLDGERPALLTPGMYTVIFDYHETKQMFGSALKVVLWFKVSEPGENFGKRLGRYYNVTRVLSRGRNGRFKVGWRSDFLREYTRLFGLPHRLDRIPMSNFSRDALVAVVRTVGQTSTQIAIPEPLQYSVIAELRNSKTPS